jgi:hypothetical protein
MITLINILKNITTVKMDLDDVDDANELERIHQTVIDHSLTKEIDHNDAPSFREYEDDDTITHSSNDDPECALSNHPIENEATKRDAKRVWRMKLLVVLILMISAISIAVLVYIHVTNYEIQYFHEQFYNDADKVYNAIGSSFELTLSTLNAFSILLVTYSQNKYQEGTNGTKTAWPFVTLPNFAGQASKLLPITNGLYIAVLPIVTPSQKEAWEEYAYQHDDWVNESLALQEVWDGYHGNISYDWPRSESIYDNFDIVYPNVRYVFFCLKLLRREAFLCIQHFSVEFVSNVISQSNDASSMANVSGPSRSKSFLLVF